MEHQDSFEVQHKICLQAQNSLYGFNNAKQMVQYVRLVYGETNFIRSEYNHCVYDIFIILVLYVMLVARTSMVEIEQTQLVRTFVMKRSRRKKINLGHGNTNKQKIW
jgi:hypothetical protein